MFEHDDRRAAYLPKPLRVGRLRAETLVNVALAGDAPMRTGPWRALGEDSARLLRVVSDEELEREEARRLERAAALTGARRSDEAADPVIQEPDPAVGEALARLAAPPPPPPTRRLFRRRSKTPDVAPPSSTPSGEPTVPPPVPAPPTPATGAPLPPPIPPPPPGHVPPQASVPAPAAEPAVAAEPQASTDRDVTHDDVQAPREDRTPPQTVRRDEVATTPEPENDHPTPRANAGLRPLATPRRRRRRREPRLRRFARPWARPSPDPLDAPAAGNGYASGPNGGGHPQVDQPDALPSPAPAAATEPEPAEREPVPVGVGASTSTMVTEPVAPARPAPERRVAPAATGSASSATPRSATPSPAPTTSRRAATSSVPELPGERETRGNADDAGDDERWEDLFGSRAFASAD